MWRRVARHPLVSFFVLANLFSWMTWVPLAAAGLGWTTIHPSPYLHLVGGFGPLVAAMIVTAACEGRAGLVRLVEMCVAGRGWLFSMVTGSILMTWLFNTSRGSILAVALFHGVLDIVMTSPVKGALPSVMGAIITLFGLAVPVVFGTTNLARGRRIQTPAVWPGDQSDVGARR